MKALQNAAEKSNRHQTDPKGGSERPKKCRRHGLQRRTNRRPTPAIHSKVALGVRVKKEMDLHSDLPFWVVKNGLLHCYPALEQDV